MQKSQTKWGGSDMDDWSPSVEWLTDVSWPQVSTQYNPHIILFVKPGAHTSQEAWRALTALRRKTEPSGVRFYAYDLDTEFQLALSLRVSIEPTLIAFLGRQKLYESICQPRPMELADVLSANWAQ